jgi:hypothetical protein
MRQLILSAAAALLAACQTNPAERRAELAVTMTGVQEVPGPGDPDGSGTAVVRVDPRQSQVCWDVYARQIDRPTAAHIHRGAEGVSGPPVVTLTTPGEDGRSQGCVNVDPALARELSMQAHGFYMNVHTTAFPMGAIRGQLRGGPAGREARPAGY